MMDKTGPKNPNWHGLRMVAVTRHVGLLLHANKEWLRLFYNQFWINPRKRGNRFPYTFRERFIIAYRMAGCGKAIIKGPPYKISWLQPPS
jgi:hypothetical protein